MRNNTNKKKQNSIAGFCKKVLVPSFAGAVYAMSQMTVTVFAAGGDTSAVTKPLDNLKTLVIAVIGAVGVCTGISAAGFLHYELRTEGDCGRCDDGGDFLRADVLRFLTVCKELHEA